MIKLVISLIYSEFIMNISYIYTYNFIKFLCILLYIIRYKKNKKINSRYDSHFNNYVYISCHSYSSKKYSSI